MSPAADLDFERLTLKDALDLAVLIEEETRDGYEELAARLLLQQDTAAAAFFTRMVRVEELHRAALVEKRERLFGGQKVEIARELPAGVEGPERVGLHSGVTERAALLTALRSERRAHRFFATALEQVKSPHVKPLFAELCAEELEHIRQVQRELDRLDARVVAAAHTG